MDGCRTPLLILQDSECNETLEETHFASLQKAKCYAWTYFPNCHLPPANLAAEWGTINAYMDTVIFAFGTVVHFLRTVTKEPGTVRACQGTIVCVLRTTARFAEYLPSFPSRKVGCKTLKTHMIKEILYRYSSLLASKKIQ